MALSIKEQGYCEYYDLKPFIKHVVNKGKNEWGFNEKIIILEDGSNWDYIPEDNMYEYNRNSNLSLDN